MKYWLFMFRPDTYAKVREHGTVGVRHGVRRRFREISKGDRFAAYISRKMCLGGYGEVTSDPYEEDTVIFAKDQVYRHRCKVHFEDNGNQPPAGDALWGMSFCCDGMKTSPTNLMLCKGGFMEISEEDWGFLRGKVDAE